MQNRWSRTNAKQRWNFETPATIFQTQGLEMVAFGGASHNVPCGSQAAGIKLGRYYYEQGGKNKWMIALSQTAGFPLLFIPLFLFPSSQNPPTSSTSPSAIVLASFYFVLGVLVASETMLFSHGLSYLSASTYSLLCPTQLIFIAVFSY